jgi:SpoVK/Ycf46/Vps4 family AAA+-type ATPase
VKIRESENEQWVVRMVIYFAMLAGLKSTKGVAVIAATNRPDIIDPALLRPGRFDRLLYVGPPNEKARQQIFQIQLHNTPCAPDVDCAALAARTPSYTGADITGVCREAALAALEVILSPPL